MAVNVCHYGILLLALAEIVFTLQTLDVAGKKFMAAAPCRKNYGYSCDEVIGDDYNCPDLEKLGWDCNGCACMAQTIRVKDLAATFEAKTPSVKQVALAREMTMRDTGTTTVTTIEPLSTTAASPTTTRPPADNVWPDDICDTLFNEFEQACSSESVRQNCEQSCTKASGEGLTVVMVKFIVRNLDYGSMTGTQKSQLTDNIKTTVASGIGVAESTIVMDINPGSVIIHCAIVVVVGMEEDVAAKVYPVLEANALSDAVTIEELPTTGNVSISGYLVDIPKCSETGFVPMGTCTIFEDPHINVFDGTQVSLLQIASSPQRRIVRGQDKQGDKWLVRSQSVSIQARYMPRSDLPERNLFVRAIAVGGTFLMGNKLIIGSLEDEITWNGEPILSERSSTFKVVDGKFVMNATRGEHSSLVEDLSVENPGVNVDLPTGVKLIANRLHQHVNIAIKMPMQEGGQAGLCGNFNGVSTDDTLEFSAFRDEVNVHPEDSLFGNMRF